MCYVLASAASAIALDGGVWNDAVVCRLQGKRRLSTKAIDRGASCARPPPGKEDASEYRQVGRFFANLCSLRAPTVAFSSLSQNQITPLTSLGADPSGRSRSW